MKIAFALEHFDKMQGGAERYACDLAIWLAQQGLSIEVFCNRYDLDLSSRFTIHRLPSRRLWGESPQACFAREFRAALEGKHFDLIQGFNHVQPADVLMLHGGLHVVFEQANAMSAATAAGRLLKKLVYRYGSKYRSLRRNEAVQFSGTDRHFVGVSEKVADDMRRVYPAASDRVHVIRLGIDGNRFDPGIVGAHRARTRERLCISDRDRVALFISNNFRLKGLWDLIDALPLARVSEPSLKLLVVGRDKTLRYRTWARLRGVSDNILFVGPVKDAFEMYAAADALIHPTHYDSCATVCLEAMACGLPVATSTSNGACEFLNDGAGGVLFDMPSSRSELAQALLEALRADVRAIARQENPDIIRAWTPERSFESVRLLYESILEARRAGS